MTLVTCRDILKPARAGGYGVAGIDVLDPISTEGVIRAAEAMGQPVLLMVPEAALGMIDIDSFFPYLVARAKAAAVPVAVHLDHGESIETVQMAIRHGFSSVMIDGSSLSLEGNIALTRDVVKLAHAAGVSVEGEIGHVGGGEGSFDGTDVDEAHYTQPNDAVRFVAETGVDSIAVAFGTVHGLYKGEPKLDLERLRAIYDKVDVPLVMHGGSGLSDAQFKDSIAAGISKINLFTEISMTAANKAIDHGLAKDRKVHFADLLLVGQKSVEAMAKRYMQIFAE
jgi:fructose-bisphosphate aldolase class II